MLKFSVVVLTLGIVGLPNVGKSTLFNALTKSSALAANYPFATIEPNIGQVPLPDPRLYRLAEIFHSQNILPATVAFVDIAGIVKGASHGEGMGNQFLANIRQADAICQVVRVFSNDDIIHVNGKVDPLKDIATIETELILADLHTIDKALPRLEKEARKNKDTADKYATVVQVREILDSGKTIFTAGGHIDRQYIHDLHLLTAKPFVFVFNADEKTLVNQERKDELRKGVSPASAVFLDAKIESELIELEPEEAVELLASIGQEEPGLVALAKEGFATLGLQTYLTAGPKESRAWTIKKGDTAPQAAGVIHSDFEKGFIKAEVVSFADLDAAGSMSAARAAGKVRIEGKDYIMADGDVVEFRFNI